MALASPHLRCTHLGRSIDGEDFVCKPEDFVRKHKAEAPNVEQAFGGG